MTIDGDRTNRVAAKFDNKNSLEEEPMEAKNESAVDSFLVGQDDREQTKRSWDARDRSDLSAVKERIKLMSLGEQSEESGKRSVGEVVKFASSSGAVREDHITVADQSILVRYLAKESLRPAWGYGGNNVAAVRDDLPPTVKRFVLAHEIYHCTDKAKWGGWIGREIRANVIPALKDPIGALTALIYNFNPDRIKFYIRRFREGR